MINFIFKNQFIPNIFLNIFLIPLININFFILNWLIIFLDKLSDQNSNNFFIENLDNLNISVRSNSETSTILYSDISTILNSDTSIILNSDTSTKSNPNLDDLTIQTNPFNLINLIKTSNMNQNISINKDLTTNSISLYESNNIIRSNLYEEKNTIEKYLEGLFLEQNLTNTNSNITLTDQSNQINKNHQLDEFNEFNGFNKLNQLNLNPLNELNEYIEFNDVDFGDINNFMNMNMDDKEKSESIIQLENPEKSIIHIIKPTENQTLQLVEPNDKKIRLKKIRIDRTNEQMNK